MAVPAFAAAITYPLRVSTHTHCTCAKSHPYAPPVEPDEIRALYNQFETFKTTTDDGKEGPEAVINRKEFQLALGCRDSLFVDRIFQLFDKNTDGLINFTEFVVGISILSTKSTLEQKLHCELGVVALLLQAAALCAACIVSLLCAPV